MAFIKTNTKEYNCQQVMIFPYLHERKLKLINEKPNCKYLYTSFESKVNSGNSETLILCINLTKMKYYIYS